MAILIAFISKIIENALPIHLIGASVIALFIGMIFNNYINTEGVLKKELNLLQRGS